MLITIYLSACSSVEDTYFPLQKGYKWRYDVVKTTRDGVQKQQYIYSNLGEAKLNDKTVSARRSLDGTTLYYAVSDLGIEYLGNRDALGLEPEFIENQQTVIAFPVAEKTEWKQLTTTRLLKKTGSPQKTEFKIIARVPMDVRIDSLSEVVSVPAGRFSDCMKITMSGSMFKDAGNYVGLTLVNVEQTNWYARGVGLIKMERVETTQSDALDRGSLTVELAQYSTD